MKKIQFINKRNLTNGQHFSFITAFVQDVKKIQDMPEQFKTVVSAMETAQQEEDKYLKMSQGSDLTEKIREADELRDNSYRQFRDIVKAWAGFGNSGQAYSAKTLQKVLKTYKINTSAQMDEESGLIANLLTDLSVDDMPNAIMDIGAKDIVADIKRGNDDVIRLLKMRDEADSAKVVGALRLARAKSDEVYADLTQVIEAYNYLQGGLDEFISKWNGTVNRYQDMLNRKTGTSKPDTPSDATNDGKDTDKPTDKDTDKSTDKSTDKGYDTVDHLRDTADLNAGTLNHGVSVDREDATSAEMKK